MPDCWDMCLCCANRVPTCTLMKWTTRGSTLNANPARGMQPASDSVSRDNNAGSTTTQNSACMSVTRRSTVQHKPSWTATIDTWRASWILPGSCTCFSGQVLRSGNSPDLLGRVPQAGPSCRNSTLASTLLCQAHKDCGDLVGTPPPINPSSRFFIRNNVLSESYKCGFLGHNGSFRHHFESYAHSPSLDTLNDAIAGLIFA